MKIIVVRSSRGYAWYGFSTGGVLAGLDTQRVYLPTINLKIKRII